MYTIADATADLTAATTTVSLPAAIRSYLAAADAVTDWEARRDAVGHKLSQEARADLADDDFTGQSMAGQLVTAAVRRLDHSVRDTYEQAVATIQYLTARSGYTPDEVNEMIREAQAEPAAAPVDEDEEAPETPEPVVTQYRYYRQLCDKTVAAWRFYEDMTRDDDHETPVGRALLDEAYAARRSEDAAYELFWKTAQSHGFTASDRAIAAAESGRMPAHL